MPMAAPDQNDAAEVSSARPAACRLLLITPAYPPMLSPATHRPAKLARYLPAYGVEPVVLTLASPAGSAVDEAALSELNHVPCIRIASPLDLAALGRRLGRAQWVKDSQASGRPRAGVMRCLLTMRDLLLLPDHRVTCLPALWSAAASAVASRSIDTVYTTGPHHSVHLVGLHLKRRLPRLCWIAEFRDAWVNDPKMVLPTRIHRWINTGLERAVLQGADAIVTVTRYMREDFLARYPGLPAEAMHVIYNGFDECDFADVAPLRHNDGRIHIVHTGTIYERAGADNVVGCLGEALRGRGERGPQVRLDLVGTVHPAAWRVLQRQVERYQLADVVRFHGCVPHRQAIAHMLGADQLLLITGPGREVVTTKVFEYMRSGHPILAVCEPASEVREILAGANVPYRAVDRNRPSQLVAAFQMILDMDGASQRPVADRGDGRLAFSRQAIARQTADLVRRLLASRQGRAPA
jgi:glycosyltransferase involved in cell wall biosynthesis